MTVNKCHHLASAVPGTCCVVDFSRLNCGFCAGTTTEVTSRETVKAVNRSSMEPGAEVMPRKKKELNFNIKTKFQRSQIVLCCVESFSGAIPQFKCVDCGHEQFPQYNNVEILNRNSQKTLRCGVDWSADPFFTRGYPLRTRFAMRFARKFCGASRSRKDSGPQINILERMSRLATAHLAALLHTLLLCLVQNCD